MALETKHPIFFQLGMSVHTHPFHHFLIPLLDFFLIGHFHSLFYSLF
jgi:hypothetical protein